MAERPQERIGPALSRFDLVWPLVVGAGCVVVGVVAAIADPSAGTIGGSVLFIGVIGGAYLWGGWDEAKSSSVVLVRDRDDLFVIRDRFGRSRRVVWHSVAGFRVTDDGVGFVDLRDRSSVQLFAARRNDSGAVIAVCRDEVDRCVARLSAILDERYGTAMRYPPPEPGPATGDDLVVGLRPRRNLAVALLAIGAFWIVIGVVSLATDPSWREAGLDIGEVVVLAGLPLGVGWRLARGPAEILVEAHDDVFVIRDVLHRTRPVAWRSVARFRTTDDGTGFVDLRDGSSIRLFSSRRRRIADREGAVQLIAFFNELLDARQASAR